MSNFDFFFRKMNILFLGGGGGMNIFVHNFGVTTQMDL